MNIPVWVAELANRFWSAAGTPEPFPRMLERPLTVAVPLTLIAMARPTVRSIQTWLANNGVVHKLNVPDRMLRACLVAYEGQGLAFIDSTDPENERRFSIAHELAHFLRDYLAPRDAAKRKLGPKAVQILDGKRKPAAAERIRALFSHTRIGVHVHLMDRGSFQPAIEDAEESADRLAYELLAPAADVAAMLKLRTQRGAVELLRTTFRLPTAQAEHYASLLLPAPRMDPLLARLRLAPSEART